ncbi:hypothetical protein HS088_TW04G00280 [Tripterygium wilfordii]|uniref:Fe2OG dioxygenase domain-containing protein n=1 Tax=Tripterygium wilfordii TaxID=458696 RepID=A0A7J7DPQ7_TRIWF|nr:hypothetical protein HS088_TW04G00280 [Tripterygium wilfordii]
MSKVIETILLLTETIKNEFNPLFEALGLYNIGSSQAVQDFCTKLDVSVHKRKIIEAYGQAVTGAAMKISEKLASSLGLNGYSFEGWPMHCRMNKFSFTPETVGSSGVRMHTDPMFFTILQDDENVGGLEVMNKSGEFVAVDPLPGSILVNFGDIGSAWSNGRFYSVKHRVQCKEASTRLSIASFVLGPKEGPVEPPPEFVDDQHPRLYASFTWEDYRKLRVSTKFRNIDGLSDVRVQPRNE